MQKEVLFGEDSRKKLLSGIQKITRAVACTMGAAGKNVLIGEAAYDNGFVFQLPTKVSKDGYTVAKHFDLQDPVEQRGAMLIKEAATKTMVEAGDSTTATCVLAESLITNGMKLIDEGANSQELKKGMGKALAYVLGELKKMSIPVKGDIERIRQIATVSANNDSSIGDLIAEAYSKIGDDGVIDIEASNGMFTEIKVFDGYKFDKGWASPLFITDRVKGTAEYENPFILLYDKRVIHHTQIEEVLKITLAYKRPLVIICEDVAEEGLAFLAMNIQRQGLQCVVAKAPDFGDARRESMEDLALITNGDYVSDVRGIDVKKIKLENLGQAKKVIVSKDETVIILDNKHSVALETHVNNLRATLEKAETQEEKYPIERRIARLTSGIATIKVGAATETEQSEKIDRVDDAVRATKAAIVEGFVAGGGAAFVKLSSKIAPFISATDWDEAKSKIATQSEDYKSKALIAEALVRPVLQICENAGIDGGKIVQQIYLNNGNNIGYNALTGEITDMVEAGIIDSTKALRCALTNAVSVAGMVLTSECSIISIA